MALTPADRGYEVQKLVDEIAELRALVQTMMRMRSVSAQRAHVTAFSGGAMCTAQFDATLNTAAVPYLLGYTPTVGHGGLVVDFGGNTLFVPVSAFL